MRAAAVQFKADKSDLAGSRDRLVALAEAATEEPVDLLVLPEMAVTGYVFATQDDVRAVSELADGPTFHALRQVARSRRCWVVCGLPERQGDDLYNSALVIDPDGALADVYRKTLLYEADEHWARPGPGAYRRFHTAGGTFGVGICMDLNDPRFLRWVWRSGLDSVAFPTNWIEEGSDVWPYWQARLAGTGSVLVAANTYGDEDAVRFSGRSAILWERGVLASADTHGDAVVTAGWRLA